ncbi:nucleoside recognition domain-containing protein [Alloiococcus sp. CFN-8]|uniref:nucleoside recognition domain-containing protein n=1 Tax=Alloiococcus sp. CFN-8 TaxID=3416081 RepID=UPI003CF3C03D
MINYIWFFMLFIGIAVGLFSGQGEAISKAVIESSGSTVELVLGLTGLMCLWCGVMKIAEKSGLTEKLAMVMKPILRLLYKGAAKNEKALGAIVMNLTANMMGLSNAATPFGIKAMEELQKDNVHKERASNDMALFLVMNAACLQLLPSTVVSIRAASGSENPGIIILPAIISTACAAVVGILIAKILEKSF